MKDREGTEPVEKEENKKSRKSKDKWFLLSVAPGEETVEDLRVAMGPFDSKADLIKDIRLAPLPDGKYRLARMSPPVTIKIEKVEKRNIEGI